jgi:hypothetical protein
LSLSNFEQTLPFPVLSFSAVRGRLVLLHLVESHRVYPPDTVAAMTVAFDMVCQSLSARVSGNDDVRRQLVLIIIRRPDR